MVPRHLSSKQLGILPTLSFSLQAALSQAAKMGKPHHPFPGSFHSRLVAGLCASNSMDLKWHDSGTAFIEAPTRTTACLEG